MPDDKDEEPNRFSAEVEATVPFGKVKRTEDKTTPEDSKAAEEAERILRGDEDDE